MSKSHLHFDQPDVVRFSDEDVSVRLLEQAMWHRT